ncbi:MULTISPECIES: O-antigen ligase family protein [Bacteroidales]|jgi:Lipid A core - O-antigen ligase and related enzymes|uniref:O-antigen ligase domain-containing protein n=2 Tax=Bacteroidaceae TaxID=815 RepID=A0A4S2AXB0_9BACE|nr:MULTISPECIES: O-antigen ligase family protein [Bacteroidales]TGY06198.1 O-antigen ligase domain-containing protein [Bacteroides acidifaciens]
MSKYLYYFFIFCFTISNSIYAFGGSLWQNAALVFFFLLALLKGVERLEGIIIYFVGCCLFSIVVNDVPAFFKPLERMVQYLLLLLAVSPLMRSYGIDRLRINLMETIVISLGILSLGSFVFYMAGGGISTIGYFGLSQHPNFLGFFAMITTVTTFALFFRSERKMQKLVIGGLFVVSLLVVMLSAARICLAGSIIGCLVFLYFHYKDRFSRLVLSLVVVGAIAMALFPLYSPFLKGVLYKQTAAMEEESATSSRDAIWATRLEEIRRYPIFGVGCFAVDTRIESDDNYYNPYSRTLGTVELGSTYLGVISQTGVVGFIGFVMILLVSFLHCYKLICATGTFVAMWLMALFAAIGVHMVVEGYATHAGSMQCLFLWLLFSCMMLPAEIIEEEEMRIEEKLGIEYDDDEDDCDNE